MKFLFLVCSVFFSFHAAAAESICDLEKSHDEFFEMPATVSYTLQQDSLIFNMSVVSVECELLSQGGLLTNALCGDSEDGMFVLIDENSKLLVMDAQYFTPLGSYSCSGE